jgi:hypothetical protein
MSEPKPRRPDTVPPLIWGVLGMLVVAAFVLALGLFSAG